MSEADATRLLGREASVADTDAWESLSVMFEDGRVRQIDFSQMAE
jgi:hypothetical protein